MDFIAFKINEIQKIADMVIAAKDFEKESIIFSHKWMPNILCSWGYYLNLRTFCCKVAINQIAKTCNEIGPIAQLVRAPDS